VLQNNGALAHQEVPHVHFHIIPKYAEASGLGIIWKPGAIDRPAAAELAALVAHQLRG
jgi:diadenosine tetraphosphate (Ap4A) HIT family hydrolase